MKHLIKIESTPNGVLGVRHAGLDQQYCEAGEQVILKWQPDAKWGLQEAHYTDGDGNVTPIDLKRVKVNGKDVVVFTMPDANITIGGTFKMFVSQDWTEGTNPSKGEVLTVGNNGEPTPISVDELANEIAEGDNNLVDSIDAINPFKGWYANLATLQASHPSPQVGDYAYVKGAESTDPAAIYECTTAGSWSDSGRTADTSNVQTFASGEEVNEVHITDQIIENSDEIPTGGGIYSYTKDLFKSPIIGTEEIFDIKLSPNYIKYSDGSVQTAGSNFSVFKYSVIPGSIKKVIATVAATDTVPAAIAFYSSNEISTDSYIGGIQMIAGTNTYETSEIPNNCVSIVITNRTATLETPSIFIIGKDDYFDSKALRSDVTSKYSLIKGNLTMTEGVGVTVSSSGGVYRIRTSKMIHLQKGSRIGLRSYTIGDKTLQFYVGWYNNIGHFLAQGWKTSDFVTYEEGDYYVLVSSDPAAIPQFSTADLIFIEQPNIGTLVNTDRAMSSIKGINHRGYNPFAPENTMMAFEMSRKVGFKFVETDVRFTSDGVPILVHNSSINGTGTELYELIDGEYVRVSGSIEVASTSWDSIKDYYLGKSVHSDYSTTKMVYDKIATFEEFVVWCRKTGIHPYIEIKITDQEKVKKVVDIVNSYGLKGRVTYIAASLTPLTYISTYDKLARLGYVVESVTETSVSYAKDLQNGYNEVFINSNTNTETEINYCKAENIPLEVWWTGVIVSDTLISRYKTMNDYISGVTTDRCDASSAIFYNF